MNCRFRAAAEGNIRLAAADHPRCIADGLGTRCAGGDRRADGAPEAVGDRHMPGGQVGQKRGDSERRETTRPAFIGGMYRIGDLAEPADPGGDHRGSAFLFGLGCWRPTGLGQRFARGDQRKLNKAIHLFALFRRDGRQRVEAVQRIAVNGRHLASHFAGNIRDQLLAESGDPGFTCQQRLPDVLYAAAQRADNPHPGDDNAFNGNAHS